MKMQKMKRRLWHAETLWSVSAEEKERARPFLFIYFFYLLQKISHKPTHVRSHSHGERASHLQFNCHVQLSIMMTGFWTQKGGWQITSKPQEPFKTPKSLIEEWAFHWVVVKYKKKAAKLWCFVLFSAPGDCKYSSVWHSQTQWGSRDVHTGVPGSRP